MRGRLLILFSILSISILYIEDVAARPWRPGLIPNGLINSCYNCHLGYPTEDHGPRNYFGLQVEDRVADNSTDPFWEPGLAFFDADGDGFTNGEELQDAEGNWLPGEPAPGLHTLVSNPGYCCSVPKLSDTPTETPLATTTPTSTSNLPTPTTTPDADLNNDGILDNQDLFSFIVQWSKR